MSAIRQRVDRGRAVAIPGGVNLRPPTTPEPVPPPVPVAVNMDAAVNALAAVGEQMAAGQAEMVEALKTAMSKTEQKPSRWKFDVIHHENGIDYSIIAEKIK